MPTNPDKATFPEDGHAVAPVVAVILMVAITVVLGAVVFVLVNNLSKAPDPTPGMGFTQSDAARTLTVVKIDSGSALYYATDVGDEGLGFTSSNSICRPDTVNGSDIANNIPVSAG